MVMEANQYQSLIDKMNEVLRVQDNYHEIEAKIDTALEKISDIKSMQIELSGRMTHLEQRTNTHSARQAIFEEKVEKAVSKITDAQARDRLAASENLNLKIGHVKDEIGNLKAKTLGINGAMSLLMFWAQHSIASLINGNKP